VPEPVAQPGKERPLLGPDRRDAVDWEQVPEIAPAQEHDQQHRHPKAGEGIKEEEKEGHEAIWQRARARCRIDAAGDGNQVNQENRNHVELDGDGQTLRNLVPHLAVVLV